MQRIWRVVKVLLEGTELKVLFDVSGANESTIDDDKLPKEEVEGMATVSFDSTEMGAVQRLT
jgi:hypothetical protein